MSPFRTLPQMESYLEVIREAPSDEGTVQMIVARPQTNERETLDRCELHPGQGLVGDNWQARGDKHTRDGSADLNRQITLMNARAIDAITGEEYWPDAGDQFFVDFDLSIENLPPGTHLGLGEAVVEVTAEPHLGCRKFSSRFGKDATRFVNSETGKALNLRGINAKVVKPGTVRKDDRIRKL